MPAHSSRAVAAACASARGGEASGGRLMWRQGMLAPSRSSRWRHARWVCPAARSAQTCRSPRPAARRSRASPETRAARRLRRRTAWAQGCGGDGGRARSHQQPSSFCLDPRRRPAWLARRRLRPLHPDPQSRYLGTGINHSGIEDKVGLHACRRRLAPRRLRRRQAARAPADAQILCGGPRVRQASDFRWHIGPGRQAGSRPAAQPSPLCPPVTVTHL